MIKRYAYVFAIDKGNRVNEIKRVTLQVPENSKFLSAGVRGANIDLYFESSESNRLVEREFFVMNEGLHWPEWTRRYQFRYLGDCQRGVQLFFVYEVLA